MQLADACYVRISGANDGALFSGRQQERDRWTLMLVYDFVVETLFSKGGIAECSIVVRHASDSSVPRLREKYVSEGSSTEKRDI